MTDRQGSREAGCTGKVQMTHKQAKHSHLTPYRCRHCGWWHVGNSKGVGDKPATRRPPKWVRDYNEE